MYHICAVLCLRSTYVFYALLFTQYLRILRLIVYTVPIYFMLRHGNDTPVSNKLPEPKEDMESQNKQTSDVRLAIFLQWIYNLQ